MELSSIALADQSRLILRLVREDIEEALVEELVQRILAVYEHQTYLWLSGSAIGLVLWGQMRLDEAVTVSIRLSEIFPEIPSGDSEEE